MIPKLLTDDGSWDSEIRKAGENLIVAEFCLSWDVQIQTADYGQLASRHPNVVFLNVSMAMKKTIGNQLVDHFPTIMFLKNGHEKDRIQGRANITADNIEKNILKYLAKPEKMKLEKVPVVSSEKPMVLATADPVPDNSIPLPVPPNPELASSENQSKFWAVKCGHKPGIFLNAEDAKAQVGGFPGNEMHEFTDLDDAIQYFTGEEKNDSMIPVVCSEKQPTGSWYYAVRSDAKHGIYKEWDEYFSARSRVSDIDCSRFEKLEEAEGFVYGSFMENRTHYEDTHTFWSDTALIFIEAAFRQAANRSRVVGFGVYWGYGHKNNLSDVLGGDLTKDRGWLVAALRAVNAAKRMEYERVILCSTNKAFIQSMGQLESWKKNGWKKPGEKANLRDTYVLAKLLSESNFKIIWKHCLTAGYSGNDGAGWLAAEGARIGVERIDRLLTDNNNQTELHGERC